MRTITECIWGADFTVTFGEDDMGFYSATNSVDVLGEFTEETLETACVEWMAGKMEVEVDAVSLVSFTWSSYETASA